MTRPGGGVPTKNSILLTRERWAELLMWTNIAFCSHVCEECNPKSWNHLPEVVWVIWWKYGFGLFSLGCVMWFLPIRTQKTLEMTKCKQGQRKGKERKETVLGLFQEGDGVLLPLQLPVDGDAQKAGGVHRLHWKRRGCVLLEIHHRLHCLEQIVIGHGTAPARCWKSW